MSDRGPITAFPAQEIAAQKQEGTGLDRDMKPLAEFTRFEAWDEHGRPYLREYVGSGASASRLWLSTLKQWALSGQQCLQASSRASRHCFRAETAA